MPMPLWWGQVNKYLFNPRELRKGERPVLEHIGRSSGTKFQTPLDAHKVDGGYVFILVYGPESDWVQNILSSGSALLKKDGEQVDLTFPRLMKGTEAWPLLGADADRPPGFLKVDDFLFMAPS